MLDSYTRALAGDSSMRDAMIVRVRVLPNGGVSNAEVRTSTNPNPAFDAEVAKDVSAWNYAPFSGSEVEIDYPIIFTNDPASRDGLETQLKTNLAGLSCGRAAGIYQLVAVAGRVGRGERAVAGRRRNPNRGGRTAACARAAAPQASRRAAPAKAADAYLAAARAAGAVIESADAPSELLYQRQHGDDFRQGLRQ